jgi:hypothetical protein
VSIPPRDVPKMHAWEKPRCVMMARISRADWAGFVASWVLLQEGMKREEPWPRWSKVATV